MVTRICRVACLECGEYQCGRTDCFYEKVFADSDGVPSHGAQQVELVGDTQGIGYHICSLCAVKSIDARHSSQWSLFFAKDFPKNTKPHPYKKEKLTVVRFFMFLDDSQWRFRNQRYMEDSNQWNNFVAHYNQTHLQGENTTTLALLYAATKDMNEKVNTLPNDIQPVLLCCHSRALWRAITGCMPGESVQHAVDISRRRLPDGSSALVKFHALMNMVRYTPVNYQAIVVPIAGFMRRGRVHSAPEAASEPPRPAEKRPRFRFEKCDFCGMDPPDHMGRHCPDNPDNEPKVRQRRVYNKCDHCGMDPPDHRGSDCPMHPDKMKVARTSSHANSPGLGTFKALALHFLMVLAGIFMALTFIGFGMEDTDKVRSLPP